MQEVLKLEFIQKYLDENGLCKLQDELTLKEVKNDNGILFSVYGYMLCDLDGADFLRFTHTVDLLTIEPGLYKRRHNADNVTEAHDNRAAIAAGSVLFDQTFARDLCDYGTRMGWQYANADKTMYSWKQLTQGGDIAFYKVCAGRLPYPTEWLWLLGGMAISIFKGWSSTQNLFYMRSIAITKAFERYTQGGTQLWWMYTASWSILRPLLHWTARKKFGGISKSMLQYDQFYSHEFQF